MRKIAHIGMLGLDTSHVSAFTKLLNDPQHPHHVPGGKVMVAYPGGSPDFPMSINRVGGYTAELRDQYGVQILETPEEVAERSDLILLEAVDGRVHLDLFKRIVESGKPVFIDKPLAVETAHAKEIARIASEHNVPVMSCSALRYASQLNRALVESADDEVIGADFFGPMELQPTQPGLFWYGIHTADMLYRVMGRGCRTVTAVTNDNYDLVIGRWSDGRLGAIRGNRKGNKQFGGFIHRASNSIPAVQEASDKPYYACLLEQIMNMYDSGVSPVDFDETLEIIRFIEAANESRDSGKPVYL